MKTINSLVREMKNKIRKPRLTDFHKACIIAKEWDAKCAFSWTGDYCEVDVESRFITIDLNEVENINHFWSLFFHELGHLWCWDNNKYDTYHAEAVRPDRIAKYMRRMALRVEKYVDTVGKRLMKDYFPNMYYRPAYGSKENVQWFKKHIQEIYPEE